LAEYTERGDPLPEIHVVDSLFTAGALALLVTAAARMAATTLSAGEIVQELEKLIDKIAVIFVADTLEYLHKGGRIGGAAALLGSMIQIKPILHIVDGKIDVLEKARTSKRAKHRLLEILEERTDEQAPVYAAIMHANVPDEAEKYYQALDKHYNCAELFICELSAVIASHIGPGTVSIAFYQ
jgi:DegV family protein with EDD domain